MLLQQLLQHAQTHEHALHSSSSTHSNTLSAAASPSVAVYTCTVTAGSELIYILNM